MASTTEFTAGPTIIPPVALPVLNHAGNGPYTVRPKRKSGTSRAALPYEFVPRRMDAGAEECQHANKHPHSRSPIRPTFAVNANDPIDLGPVAISRTLREAQKDIDQMSNRRRQYNGSTHLSAPETPLRTEDTHTAQLEQRFNAMSIDPASGTSKQRFPKSQRPKPRLNIKVPPPNMFRVGIEGGGSLGTTPTIEIHPEPGSGTMDMPELDLCMEDGSSSSGSGSTTSTNPPMTADADADANTLTIPIPRIRRTLVTPTETHHHHRHRHHHHGSQLLSGPPPLSPRGVRSREDSVNMEIRLPALDMMSRVTQTAMEAGTTPYASKPGTGSTRSSPSQFAFPLASPFRTKSLYM